MSDVTGLNAPPTDGAGHLSGTDVPTRSSDVFRAGSDVGARAGAVPLASLLADRFDPVSTGSLTRLDRPPNTYIAGGSNAISVRIPVSDVNDPRIGTKLENTTRTAFGPGMGAVVVPPDVAATLAAMGQAQVQAAPLAPLAPSTQNTSVTPTLVGQREPGEAELTVRPGVSITGNGVVAFATLEREADGGHVVRFEVLRSGATGGGSDLGVGRFDGRTLWAGGREIALPPAARAALVAMLEAAQASGGDAPSPAPGPVSDTRDDFDALVRGGIRA